MSVLTKDETTIALYEICAEYKVNLNTLVNAHSNLLKKNIDSTLSMEARLYLNAETTEMTKAFKKIEELDNFLKALQGEYLALTKPHKH